MSAWRDEALLDAAVLRFLVPHIGEMAKPICYHAQQYAEKCIKDVLTERGVSFRKTHDLLVLLRQVESSQDAILPLTEDVLIAASALTDYEASSRYPDIEYPPTEMDARLAMGYLRTINGYLTTCGYESPELPDGPSDTGGEE